MRHDWLAQPQYHRGILIDQIPVKGVPGLLFVASTGLTVLGGLQAAREFFLISGIAGVLWAGVLYWWHNQTRW